MTAILKCLAAASLLSAAVMMSLAPAQQAPLYKNPNAPLDKRVEDLLSKMTLEEKISQLTSDSPAIARLDIPQYNWWNECLHGVARGAGHRVSGNDRDGGNLGHEFDPSRRDRDQR